jgi:hypothetical protein
MLFKSALLTQGSGSLMGITASHNRGGAYLRGRTIPTNPNTAQQQAVRNALSALQVRYAGVLTALQRTGWQTYATNTPVTNSLGDAITLTGQQMYVKCNTLRSQAGVSIIDAPPATTGLISLTLPVATIVAAGTTASVAFSNTDSWANAAGGYLLVYSSRLISGTINYFKGPYRFAAKITGSATPPTSPAVITLPFSIGATGTKMGFRYVAIGADGRVSPELFQLATTP